MSDRESTDAVRRNFADRHIGPNEYQIKTMLLELGFDSLDKFVEKVVPANIFWNQELDLPQPVSETQALAEIKELAKSNQVKRSMIGTGYYATKLPNVPVLPAGSLPATVNVPPTGLVNTIALAVVSIVALPRYMVLPLRYKSFHWCVTLPKL